jgi:hypothetical protein
MQEVDDDGYPVAGLRGLDMPLEGVGEYRLLLLACIRVSVDKRGKLTTKSISK